MEDRKIYIIGRGLINPAGNDLGEFWNNMINEKICYAQLNIKDEIPVKIGASVHNFNATKYISKRIAVKTDCFTQYFLAATVDALNEANIIVEKENCNEIGIFFGNNSGGWNICERGFKELFFQSYSMVNPWQATAWFPTAGQGYASIMHKVKGFSKTFVSDRVSGAAAVYHGIESLINNRNKIVVVGGSEAPLTPLGITCYNESGSISKSNCSPFLPESPGVVLSEGGAAIVIESSDKISGVPIAEIRGYATNYYADNQITGVVECMETALSIANINIEDVDLVIPEGNGDWASDYIEKEAIKMLFNERLCKIPILFTKYYLGHQYGAAAITDIICACMALEHNMFPKYKNIEALQDYFTDEIVTEINNVLVNSRTASGVNYSFLISKIGR
jgi:3-oxoacyl-[acyl-carrier-protein] synthase II